MNFFFHFFIFSFFFFFRSDTGGQESDSSDDQVSLDDSLSDSPDFITKHGEQNGDNQNQDHNHNQSPGKLEIKVWARGVARFRLSRLVGSLVDRFVAALNEFVLECFILNIPICVGEGRGEEEGKLGMVKTLVERLEELRADSVAGFRVHNNEAERLEQVISLFFFFFLFFLFELIFVIFIFIFFS